MVAFLFDQPDVLDCFQRNCISVSLSMIEIVFLFDQRKDLGTLSCVALNYDYFAQLFAKEELADFTIDIETGLLLVHLYLRLIAGQNGLFILEYALIRSHDVEHAVMIYAVIVYTRKKLVKLSHFQRVKAHYRLIVLTPSQRKSVKLAVVLDLEIGRVLFLLLVEKHEHSALVQAVVLEAQYATRSRQYIPHTAYSSIGFQGAVCDSVRANDVDNLIPIEDGKYLLRRI